MKIPKKIQLAVLIIFIQIFLSSTAFATPATSYTRTIDAKGHMVRTQDAYLPDRTIVWLQLSKPDDIFIDSEDYLYIADTDNKRIVKYDARKDKIVLEITHEEMKQPRGVFVTEGKEIYVADTLAHCVFIFSGDGSLLDKITKPNSISFGNNDFNPMKVAVDKGGNLYILGEGIYDGIIQLARTGEFLGYFTSNKVSLSFVERLQDLLFTEQQKANLLGRTPITFSNVFADTSSIVYTSTMGTRNMQAIKKHNTAGQNMLQPMMAAVDTMTDLYADKDGIIYAAGKDGQIYVYTRDGEFIYLFGSNNADHDVSGLFTSLAAIAVDSEGRIWTVDNEKNFLQSFVPTEYSRKIYIALNEFNKGNYQESIAIWEEILRLNQMSVLAHNNIGRNFLFQEQYEKAMYHTRIAGNRFFYSQAYWEVRNVWLQKHISYILSGIIIFYLLSILLRWADRKHQILSGPKMVLKTIYEIKPVKDVLFMFKFFRHPVDSFYDLKVDKQGSLTGAILLYIGFFIAYVWSLVGKGFIYQFVAPEDVDLQTITVGYFSITLLFVLCNYLVTSIKDGEGSFGQIFKLLSYAMGPLLLSLIISTAASHFLTFNEVFLLQFIMLGGAVWTSINIVIGVQEVHTYDTSVAIKSIFITFGFMIIISVILIIVLIMGDQLYQFIEAVTKEVIRNVFG